MQTSSDTARLAKFRADAGLPPLAAPRPLVPADLKVERSLIRLCVAHCVAACRPGSAIAPVLRELFPTERVAPLLLQRAASAPAMTNIAGWAQELAGTAVQAFIRTLQDSAGATLLNAGVQVDLTGRGKINLPRVSVGGTAAWIGEGSPIPVVQGTTTSPSLSPHKIGMIESLTRESFEHSQPAGAESWMQIVLQDMAKAALDTSLFSSAAGSATRPPGIVAGITPLTASTATGIVAVTEDFRALVDAIVAAGGGGEILFFCSPGRALAAKSLMPAIAGQVFGSAQIPSAELFAVCPGAFVSAFGPNPEIAASGSVTLHFEDTAPVDIGVAGAPATVAAPSKSMFQTDSIAFRMILTAGWGLRIPNTAQWIQTGMTW
jgi:hypothetical protein